VREALQTAALWLVTIAIIVGLAFAVDALTVVDNSPICDPPTYGCEKVDEPTWNHP
jgi:hypothetical protein